MTVPYLAIALLTLTTLYAAIVSFCRRPTGSISKWLFPERSSKPTRVSVGTLTVVAVLCLATWFAITVHKSTGQPSRFLIPEGYSGWVRVEFNIPGTPLLPMEKGQTILKIPPEGVLRTSSPEQYGWAKDSYYAYSVLATRPLRDTGPDRRIWGKINGESSGSSGKVTYQEFFVGTNQQFSEQSK